MRGGSSRAGLPLLTLVRLEFLRVNFKSIQIFGEYVIAEMKYLRISTIELNLIFYVVDGVRSQ